MTMNKILAILIFVFCIQTMNAQTTLTISILKSNRWMLIEDGTKDTVLVSFDNKKMYTSEHIHYVHPRSGKVIDETLKINYTYYLLDTFSTGYDAEKVGKATSGKFITVHNVSSAYVDSSEYTTFEIKKKSNSEYILTLCGFPPESYNNTGRIFFLKKKQ